MDTAPPLPASNTTLDRFLSVDTLMRQDVLIPLDAETHTLDTRPEERNPQQGSTRSARTLILEPSIPFGASEVREAALPFKISKIDLSLDMVRFCLRNGIWQYLTVAIGLIEECFPSIRQLRLQTEEDPETGDEWLVLDITIEGEVDEVLDNYDNYTDRFVSSVPWPKRDKIRLSYNMI